MRTDQQLGRVERQRQLLTRPLRPAKPHSCASPRRRGGGIALEDGDEEEAPASAAASPAEASEAAAAKADSAWAELNAKPAAATKRRAPVDDLWAQMNAPTAPAPKKQAAGAAAGAPAAQAAPAVRYSVPGVCASKRPGYVSLSEVKDFVGEKHVVSRELRVGSKEELALRAVAAAGFPLGTPLPPPAAAGGSGGAGSLLPAAAAPRLAAPAGASLGSGLRAAQALAAVRALNGGGAPKPPAPGGPEAPAAPAAGGGLSALLARIDKPKKMSTMEKSALDWGKFKAGAGAEAVEEMERYAQDGYLERQAFLGRMDQRQADNARDVRRKRMGVKD